MQKIYKLYINYGIIEIGDRFKVIIIPKDKEDLYSLINNGVDVISNKEKRIEQSLIIFSVSCLETVQRSFEREHR